VSARHRNLGPPPLPAREAAPDILGWAGRGDVALVFGNETAGLSNAEVQRCQRTVFIPANPDYSSLNLASAVQLLCYELRLAAFDGRPPVIHARPSLRLAAGDPRGHRTLLSAPRAGDGQQRFLDPQRPRRLMPKLRRLFGRAELERDEINILRGMLDAVERTVGRAGRPAAQLGDAARDALGREVGTSVGIVDKIVGYLK
jgi:tRNA/rRNA methyltransferase